MSRVTWAASVVQHSRQTVGDESVESYWFTNLAAAQTYLGLIDAYQRGQFTRNDPLETSPRSIWRVDRLVLL